MSKSKIKIIDDLIVAGRPEAGGEEQSEEKALLRQAPISPRRRLRRNSCVPLAELQARKRCSIAVCVLRRSARELAPELKSLERELTVLAEETGTLSRSVGADSAASTKKGSADGEQGP